MDVISDLACVSSPFFWLSMVKSLDFENTYLPELNLLSQMLIKDIALELNLWQKAIETSQRTFDELTFKAVWKTVSHSLWVVCLLGRLELV